MTPGTIHLLLGRHGPRDHYLGGRYKSPARGRSSRSLAFPLTERTIHLFELITSSQLREPVPPGRIFSRISSHYDRTALAFARDVEGAGGKSYNAESRPSARMDRHYASLREEALAADLAFFKRPSFDRYLALAGIEARFGALREDLIAANLEHFASRGYDVVARLGRVHSTVRRISRSGFVVRTHIGAGSFFPEQVLKRRVLLGLDVREEDRERGYIDRFLRIVPAWEPDLGIPSHEFLLSLRGETLAAVHRRFDARARASRSLPDLRDLVRILEEDAGYRPPARISGGDPRFMRIQTEMGPLASGG